MNKNYIIGGGALILFVYLLSKVKKDNRNNQSQSQPLPQQKAEPTQQAKQPQPQQPQQPQPQKPQAQPIYIHPSIFSIGDLNNSISNSLNNIVDNQNIVETREARESAYYKNSKMMLSDAEELPINLENYENPKIEQTKNYDERNIDPIKF